MSSVTRGIRKAPEIIVTSSDCSFNGVARKVEGEDSSRVSSPSGSSLLKLVPVQVNEVDLQIFGSNKKSNYLIDEKSRGNESYVKTETDISSYKVPSGKSEVTDKETKEQFFTRMRVATTEAVKQPAKEVSHVQDITGSPMPTAQKENSEDGDWFGMQKREREPSESSQKAYVVFQKIDRQTSLKQVKKLTVLKRNSTPPQKKEAKKTEMTINLKAIKVQTTETKGSRTPKGRRNITKSKSMSAMEIANEQQKQLLKVFDDSPIKEEDEE